MVITAKQHFDQDMARAEAILAHSNALADGVLKDDLLRAAWMMGVGACDAYFSDAYADLIARTLRAKEAQKAINIPDRLNSLKVPVIAILSGATNGWRWRMAARELIENENVLSLDKIRSLFNQFFRKGHKLLSQETIETWILHKDAKQRLFGISKTAYRASVGAGRATAKSSAVDSFHKCFEGIFQRRHDCIHNCDRPKVALQQISAKEVRDRLVDIKFLVCRCHEAFLTEFPIYLTDLGFSAATRNSVRFAVPV
jgi:hypothetical protein